MTDCPVTWTFIPKAIEIVPKVLVPARPAGATLAFAISVTDPTEPVLATPDTLTSAFATGVTVPSALVPAKPESVITALWWTAMDPRLAVAFNPVLTGTLASPSTSTETEPTVPTAPCIEAIACAFTPATGAPVVPTKEAGVILASASTVAVPNAEVAANPVSVTGLGSPQVSEPQDPLPQPVILAMCKDSLSYSYNRCGLLLQLGTL